MTARTLEVSLTTSIEAEEPVAALMERLFRRTPALYTGEEAAVTKISVYLESERGWTSAKRIALLRGLAQLHAAGLAIEPARLRLRSLRPESWIHAWKRHFQPVEIGAVLLVKPTWSRRRPQPWQAVVTLDPGLSFGTGQHPTTRFCLEQVVACRNLAQPPSLLDVGTGSGILAIAAAAVGYQPTIAFDLDPVAVKAARANARVNRVARQVRFLRDDVRHPRFTTGTPFHLVCANLTSDLLLAQAGRLARWVHPKGRLVLAGILKREFRAVRDACSILGLRLVATRVGREWQSGAFVWAHH